jgi:glucosylceramidase
VESASDDSRGCCRLRGGDRGPGNHCYGGDPTTQNAFHAAYPATAVYFTECTGGAWSTATAVNLVWEIRNNPIAPIRDWARASTYSTSRSIRAAGRKRGLRKLPRDADDRQQAGDLLRERGLLLLGAVLEVRRSGRHARDSPDLGGNGVEKVAFRNPDGSIVLVALNPAAAG